ncbi:hypothetical protein BGZ54_010602 [Gamsiella multidivaricata]|nr:hypothetical protein BGZ54_010602 [Gamsiella multidivaricata]
MDGTRIASPPQYMSYMLDQPVLDPESVVVYPDPVHFGTAQQGLIQHIALLGQHQQECDLSSQDNDLTRPIVTTTTTTTTTTTLTTALSPPPRSFAPIVSSAAAQQSSADRCDVNQLITEEVSTPAVSTPQDPESSTPTSTSTTTSPTSSGLAFLGGRHLSILRMGLTNYSRGHHNSNRNSQVSHRTSRSSPPSSSNPSPTASRSASPHRGSNSNSNSNRNSDVPTVSFARPDLDSSANRDDNSNSSSSSSGTGNGENNRFCESIVSIDTVGSSSAMTERSESSRSGLVMPPGLYRHRSTGPPPYIPLSPEAAPPLPPSYNAVASDI